MDGIQIKQIDGEPPIYMEMKTVPVSLENCILNSEEDYYQNDGSLSVDDYDDGNLSAEEINNMIMINEGPNVLSSAGKGSMKPQIPSPRKSSEIKQILTNRLPKADRFLSTKSLKKLTGAQKKIGRKRFANEEETDTDGSEPKNKKKKVSGNSKNLKRDDLKVMKTLKQVKLLEKKAKSLEKETKRLEKLKQKHLKELENSHLLPEGKKAIKTGDKKKAKEIVPIKKSKNKSDEPIQAEKRPRKKAAVEKETKVATKRPKLQPQSEENSKVVSTSRSGRVRKIRTVSDEYIKPPKEAKAVTPVPGQEKPQSAKAEAYEAPIGIDDNKLKPVNTDLLQNALNESVECWFDISSKTKKGKRCTSVKLVARNKKTGAGVVKDDVASNEKAGAGVVKDEVSVTDEPKTVTEEGKTSIPFAVVSAESLKENMNVNKDQTEAVTPKKNKLSPRKKNQLGTPKKSPKNKLILRKNKPNRKITSFTKKRRRVRNLVMTKKVLNYGEKIDFNEKIEGEEGLLAKEYFSIKSVRSDTTDENSSMKSSCDSCLNDNSNSESVESTESSRLKELRLKLRDISDAPLDSDVFKSINNVHEVFTEQMRLKNRFRRCHSVESFSRKSPEQERRQARLSKEMPEVLPSRMKDFGIITKECSVFLQNIDISDYKTLFGFKNQDNATRELNRAPTPKNDKKENENIDAVEETVTRSRSRSMTRCKNANETAAVVPVEVKITKRTRRNVRRFASKYKCKSDDMAIEPIEEVGDNEREIADPASGSLNIKIEPKDPTDNSFELGSMSKCIPLKKRGQRRRRQTADMLIKQEALETGEMNDSGSHRRRSFREIKLTPKLVDMIAHTSTRRSRSVSHVEIPHDIHEEQPFIHPLSRHRREAKEEKEKEPKEVKEIKETKENDSAYSNLINRTKSDASNVKTENTPSNVSVKSERSNVLPVPDSIENYLQSKMEANASNFECSWEPGDLVWARFAGNPFWPSLVLRDPFSSDEFTRVKYLGRQPRLFIHVQFLADMGRRAWGPEIYLMNYNGMDHFYKLKTNMPDNGTQKKDLVYRQAFNIQKKVQPAWLEAVKEAEALVCKTRDERITYMKIKYPLVKYAASFENGHLVPNVQKRPKSFSPNRRKKRSDGKDSQGSNWNSDQVCNEWSEEIKQENDKTNTASDKADEIFECVDTTDQENSNKDDEKTSPKITLKLVRSPKKESKRKSRFGKKPRKISHKESTEEEYLPSEDSGSNGEKTSERGGSTFLKKMHLFKGSRLEKVCEICMEWTGPVEAERPVKCKGVCQGFFHVSCVNKMKTNSDEPLTKVGVKRKRRKKLFTEESSSEQGESTDDVKVKEEPDWMCNDCSRGENACFVCKSSSGNRQRCCVGSCGKFYHQKCLKLFPQTVYNQGAPIKKHHLQQTAAVITGDSPNQQILSCPLHVCHTCSSDNPAEAKMKYLYEKLVKCVACPTAYHGGNFCIPAGSRILSISQIICGKHQDQGQKKSHVNISWCFICNVGGSLICCDWCPSSFHIDCLNIKKPPEESFICEECESGRFPLHGEVVWVKLGRYRWWPARVLFPQEIPPNVQSISHKSWEFAVRFYGSNDHYWLNRGRVFLFQEGDSEQNFKAQKQVDKLYQIAVKDATRDYYLFKDQRKVSRERTSNAKLSKPPPYVKINTNKAIGKVQLGNPSEEEPPTCDCDPNTEAPCSPAADCLNRMLLLECNPNYCNAGSRCGNQCFEKKEYPPLTPYRTETRGWGLKSSVDIRKGQFVIEYVGEVVNDEELRRRLKRKHEMKDNNYYFLTIDKDRIIDAGPKGNLARFMNHSCSPNCETQKWTVNGDTRVGLFALVDIPAGTELTFNYNLDCAGNEKKICKCGGENCAGFIGVKVNKFQSTTEKGREKGVKRSDWKDCDDECFVCNDGGELMVCDVKDCPKVYHIECVGLTDWPNETWLCPRHKCSICDKATKRCCKLCPTAFCFSHTDNNVFSDNNGGLLCSTHSATLTKPSHSSRKPSYVNRNTPIIEYEKPFAEKYRPPPLKERLNSVSSQNTENEILMEPNLTDNTPILVENPLLTSQSDIKHNASSSPDDNVSVKVVYVDDEGRIIVNMDKSNEMNETIPSTNIAANDMLDVVAEPVCNKPIMKRKKRTNIPRKKIYPHLAEETENKVKAEGGGINFESIMIKSVEDKILDSKLNMDNIYNIIGGSVVGGGNNSEKCGDEMTEQKTESKKDDAEVDRSRRSKYFKIVTPEKFIKTSENDSNPKTVTDFNYIEFMHPLRSSRNRSKVDESTRK